jgi:DNA-binding transcriptional MocR family regulator
MAVLFHIQKRKNEEPLPLYEWARLLGYSRMTMSRACQELVDAGLADKVRRGHAVMLQFESDRRQLWERASGLMVSPVLQRIVARLLGNRPEPFMAAGLSALSKYSEVAADPDRVLAMTPSTFETATEKRNLARVPFPEPDTVVVEKWRYEPAILSKDGQTVDPLSLYLALRATNDERIKTGLNELLKGIQWQKD